jgi:phenylalanyl-tRNA synthetase alpha chain
MDKQKILDSLSPQEIKVLPYIKERVNEICVKSNLNKVSVLRALQYLENKKIVKLSSERNQIVELGVNGALYLRKGLPERKLLSVLSNKRILPLNDAAKESGLSNDEFKAALGVLRKKNAIEMKNNKIILSWIAAEISKKMPEEIFLESLPKDFSSLSEENQELLKNLRGRKELVHLKEDKDTKIEVTELGKSLMHAGIKSENLIEQITPELIKKEAWKGKKFRRYDITSNVSEIHGGKRHFVNQASDYARKIWTDMGFKEMSGNMVQSSFWNFDALFTAQDHPVREMQDTFFINKKMNLPDKKIVKNVKESHEGKLKNVESKGWQYDWGEEDSKKAVLRTHTTCLSAQTLAGLDSKEDLPAKFFALGKCFRNETVDWKHGFEFNQTEGIVIDKNANFRHLLGYLKQFFKKMGFEKIRFRPAYFPYTEPSVEVDVYHEGKKEWLELGGAGIFRPEVVIPLLGENIPVLAWGPGFDRILMDYYSITDLRDLYKNDLNQIRKMKFWMKQ